MKIGATVRESEEYEVTADSAVLAEALGVDEAEIIAAVEEQDDDLLERISDWMCEHSSDPRYATNTGGGDVELTDGPNEA